MGRQSVRISQAVLTLGPGALLESREGPRVILRHGLSLPAGLSMNNLEITSPELELLLRHLFPATAGGQPRIFQVPPSTAIPGIVWKTAPFPEWRLCVVHQILHRNGCPRCQQETRSPGRRRGNRDAVRFVLACPDGHLDDVDWDTVVHGHPPPHSSSYYLWESRGSSLSDIYIRCPRCRKAVSLGRAYQLEWPCTGRFPEQEPPGSHPLRHRCDRKAIILQRQASNLRVPVVFSLLVIPPLSPACTGCFRGSGSPWPPKS